MLGPVSATAGFHRDIDISAMYKIPAAQKRSSPPVDCFRDVIVWRD